MAMLRDEERPAILERLKAFPQEDPWHDKSPRRARRKRWQFPFCE